MSMVEDYDKEEWVGYRFHASDEELIRNYLQPKIAKQQNKEVELEDKNDIYAKEPWQLTHTETDLFEPNQWFYFVKLSNNVNGQQMSRRVRGETCEGFWKAKGRLLKDIVRKNTSEVIGKKRKLSFYVTGSEHASGWTMTEYYVLDGGSFHSQALCHLRGPRLCFGES